jgi:uncharacterized protein (TIGR03437 family)
LLAGSSAFTDIPLTPGVAFSPSVGQRTTQGSFLAAFDLAAPSVGGALACVADGLTNMPIGPVAPGQLISLFGSGIGPDQPAIASLTGPDPVPFTLGGVTVTFEGIAAPIAYASSTQVNLGVPWEVQQKSTTLMQVTIGGTVVATRLFGVAAGNPSLFVDTNQTAADGNDFYQTISLNPDASKNSKDNPAPGGSWVTLYLNGAGLYPGGTPPQTGSISSQSPEPIDVPVVVAAGTTALETGPLTAWPGVLSGLYQIQVHLPVYQQSPIAVALTVTVNGVPASPQVYEYYGRVYQSEGLVWMKN